MILIDLLLVLLLILANGVLAMSELAIVSARRGRLKALADEGQPAARTALALAEEPGRFLSTVQIGITLIGVLAGTFSGATIAEEFAKLLEGMGISGGVSETLSIVTVVAAVTYLSLIIGELVPKQIALRHAERAACATAPLMNALSALAGPLVSLIDASASAGLWLLRVRGEPVHKVTDEEIRSLVAEAESAGVVKPAEKNMIGAVMRLGDRRVGALMTPRPDIDWIDLEEGEESVKRTLLASRHSRLLVARGSVDQFEGVIHTKHLLDALLAGRSLDLKPLLHPPPVFHETADALTVVETLRNADHHIGVVLDEYGSVQGLVTRADVLESIIGALHETEGGDAPLATQREDGSWLLDGAMPVDEMRERIGYLPPEGRDYHTVAGFMLAEMQHLPVAGEYLTRDGWRFEVVDMDGRRIDKILASRLPDIS